MQPTTILLWCLAAVGVGLTIVVVGCVASACSYFLREARDWWRD